MNIYQADCIYIYKIASRSSRKGSATREVHLALGHSIKCHMKKKGVKKSGGKKKWV